MEACYLSSAESRIDPSHFLFIIYTSPILIIPTRPSFTIEQYKVSVVYVLRHEMMALVATLEEEYQPILGRDKLDSNNCTGSNSHAQRSHYLPTRRCVREECSRQYGG